MKDAMIVLGFFVAFFVAGVVFVACGEEGGPSDWRVWSDAAIADCRAQGGQPVTHTYYEPNIFKECILP